MAGPINLSMQAKTNSFVAETNACIPKYLCFAQLNSESVIVHIEILKRQRQDGQWSLGRPSRKPPGLPAIPPFDSDSYLDFRPLQLRPQQSCHN